MDKDVQYKDKQKNTIKNLDISQRPRELLLEKGVEFLSDEQLLAILIDTGTKEHNAIEIAKQLIEYAGSLESLIRCDIDMIKNIKGIGTAKACKIIASIEFANRVARKRTNSRASISSPADLAEMFSFEFDRCNVEVFKLICLDVKNHIIYSKNITMGVADCSVITPREIFKEALLRHAVGIIAMHNHPSGNPKPSKEDISVTIKIKDAGDIIGIKLLDHIVYGSAKNYYSFKENGYI